MPKIIVIQTNSGDDVADNLARIKAAAQAKLGEIGGGGIGGTGKISGIGGDGEIGGIGSTGNTGGVGDIGETVIALPECFALMPKNTAQLRARAEIFGDGEIQNFIAELARNCGVWILAGSLPLQSPHPNKVFNSSLVFDAAGKNVARYDKIHLFDADISAETSGNSADNADKSAAKGRMAKAANSAETSANSGENAAKFAKPETETYRESAYTAAGEKCVVARTPIGALGLSVCYDLRFPEIYRELGRLGAACFAVPAAFACATGAAHWLALLRARAIENGVYVIAAAQVGAHPSGRRTYGHSVVIDPWGDVIASLGGEPGAICAEIDAAKVAAVRAQLPCRAHRRADLFS